MIRTEGRRVCIGFCIILLNRFYTIVNKQQNIGSPTRDSFDINGCLTIHVIHTVGTYYNIQFNYILQYTVNSIVYAVCTRVLQAL